MPVVSRRARTCGWGRCDRSRSLVTLAPSRTDRPVRRPPRLARPVLEAPLSANGYPAELTYTAEHEWLRAAEGGRLRVGITAYAQDALGDVVFVTLPAVGTAVDAGEALGEVESTKSVSDVYAPLAGTVVAVNEALDATPELVNSDPYGEGWMFELEPAGGADALRGDGLLDAAAYEALLP